MPIFENPLAGTHRVVQLLTLKACHRSIRIRIAVENQNARFRLRRRNQEVEGENRHACTLKALHPFLGPPVNFLHGIGHESLFSGELATINRISRFFEELLVDVIALARFKAEARRVADVRATAEQLLTAFHPVMNDAILARHVIKEAIDIFLNHHIHVKEERRPLQIAETILVIYYPNIKKITPKASKHLRGNNFYNCDITSSYREQAPP